MAATAQFTTKGTELGLDGFFGASTIGGSFGIGAKYGIKANENLVFGPSVRLQRSWSNYYGNQNGFTIYGGGAWAHFRFYRYLFVGAELELLNSPINYANITSTRSWVPTCFLGGGFSYAFPAIRINAGIFCDPVNHLNSPFRPGYIMHKANGALLPVIYRVGIFLPL
jgi:hypothetical protein